LPRAHVQFLEQAGIKVVPISYLDPIESIEVQLDQVNGVYCPGDSARLLDDPIYKETFKVIYDYVEKSHRVGDYFPLFLMGKSGLHFVK
jgi:hypothetical protein